jgi:pilus assembly protein Flp/PilA
MYIHPILRAWVESRFESDRGASLVEYALLLALIAMVCIAAVTALGETTSASFSEAVSELG